jgi:phospholipase C
MDSTDGLSKINHFVVLMLENRSFDHMLGFLYPNKKGPNGQPFEGLTGKETNLGSQGKASAVFQIEAGDPDLYFYPKADPGEGFHNTNQQLFGTQAPAANAQPTMGGFIQNYASTLKWDQSQKDLVPLPGTVETDIMGCFTPAQLPVISGLAKGYAVCDQWFASAPTETLPNRAFALMATSQGHLDDKTKVFTAKSIFSLLEAQGVSWSVYGYSAPALTIGSVADITQADPSHFGLFTDFENAVDSGNLASFVFLEPSWDSQGNSQHPAYDVAAGEQLIYQVYNKLASSPIWNETLLVITYDEHGGCYDHVAPPATVAPDDSAGQYGFNFDRLGLRVPTVLVSPWIAAGTVCRAPEGAGGTPVPFDHTSLLKTVEVRFGLPSLTQRDAQAADFGGVFTLDAARKDNPLLKVTPPVNPAARYIPDAPTHLQQVHADLASDIHSPEELKGLQHHTGLAPAFSTGTQADDYIRGRYQNLMSAGGAKKPVKATKTEAKSSGKKIKKRKPVKV